MPDIPFKQFKLDLVYYQNIVLGLLLLPCLFITMAYASIFFTDDHLKLGLRNIIFFGTFFGSVYGWSYLFTARCLITVKTEGMMIKVTKRGLGSSRRTERFYTWAEVESFRDYQVRGGRNIGLYFRDDTHITFSDSKRALFDYLITYFPNKKYDG